MSPSLSGYEYTMNATITERYALITASPNHKPHHDVLSVSSIFLLPGALELGYCAGLT